MKFYGIPLCICVCLLSVLLANSENHKKHEKILLFMLLALTGAALIYALFMLFRNEEVLFVSVFFVVALICQQSMQHFIKIQEAEGLFSQRSSYCILLTLWISLVVSFYMEARAIQIFLDTVLETRKGGIMNYLIVLMLCLGLLVWMEYKIKGKPVMNQYFLHFTGTTGFLLCVFLFFEKDFSQVITVNFDTIMVFYVIHSTVKLLGEYIETFQIMRENLYFYLCIFLWTGFAVSFVLELRSMTLPI